MTSRLHIHGAWWIRDENLGDAVARTNQTFQRLAEVAPSWERWYLPHDRLSKIGQPEQVLSNNPELIRRRFLVSQESTIEGPADPDLGYWLTASSEPENGRGLQRSYFHVVCCKRGKYAGRNVLSIEFPLQELCPEMYTVDLLSRAVDVLKGIWDPDWLIALDLLAGLTPEPWLPGPVLGWVNYLSERIATVDKDIPPEWSWYGSSKAAIFVYRNGRPDPKNPEHVAAFRQVNSTRQP